MFQLPNSRPDCNGYVVRVTDTELLKKIVSTGLNKTMRATNLLQKLSDDDVCWGTLYWARQIKKNTAKDAAPNTMIIEEIYWLDIVYRVKCKDGEVVMPLIRVYHDSIGMVPFLKTRYTESSLTDLFSRPAYYVDSNNAILSWHELAAALGVHDNIYYVRACLRAVNFAKDVIAKKPGATGYRHEPILVYRSDGNYRVGPRDHQAVCPPPFDLAQPYAQQVTPFSTMELSGYRSVPPTVTSRLYSTLAVLYYTALIRTQAFTPPNPEQFPDDSNEGKEFIYFVCNQFAGVRYEGHGLFSYDSNENRQQAGA